MSGRGVSPKGQTGTVDVTALMDNWQLNPDGDVIHTASSDVYPVIAGGHRAMLKVARVDEETRGHDLMTWLDGEGAARVYRRDGDALLMERLDAAPSLLDMVRSDDDGATGILVRAAQAVHCDRPAPWPELPTLRRWFRALETAAPDGEVWAEAWAVASSLLDDPRDVRPLHGDLHHANVLWSGERGWVVIDPKGLIGDSGYDYANMLCNPSLEFSLSPGRLERQIAVVAQAGGPPPQRLLGWVQAYAALSAAWSVQDGHAGHAEQTLELSRLAGGLLSARQN